MINKTSLLLSFLFILFFQVNYCSANNERFCLLYDLAPEHEAMNELDDCKLKLSETNKEISLIKKVEVQSPDINNELVSCEKELIIKIKDLEDLKELANQNIETNFTEISSLQDTGLNN